MKALPFPESNVTFARDQPQYNPLPGWTDGQSAVFCYGFSWWERVKLLFGAKLWVENLTYGMPLQPQRLSLEKPLRPLTAEELAAAVLADEGAKDEAQSDDVPPEPTLRLHTDVDDAVPIGQPDHEHDPYTVDTDFVETDRTVRPIENENRG